MFRTGDEHVNYTYIAHIKAYAPVRMNITERESQTTDVSFVRTTHYRSWALMVFLNKLTL